MISQEQILKFFVPLVYARRRLSLGLLIAFTVLMLYQALQVGVDAGFEKQIPLEHPYMKTFKEYEKTFGGANLISVALMQKEGDIYNEAFLDKLKKVTDEVFFLPGVDRSQVRSLFTPGVRYMEIVEDGFSGGDVVPRDYKPTPEMFDQIRNNVGKANIIGRLVANEQNGAMIVAELLEYHPVTGEKLDYQEVADKLEAIRLQFATDDISIHIIGFAKIIGDVTDAALEVVSFFIVALLLTMLLLWAFCGSLRLSLLPLAAAVVAVIWEFGLLHSLGYGLDPFAILVPFLVLSIGVSHGVQYINAWGNEVAENGLDSYDASVETFRRLAIPGTTALITDVIGFATIALIQIDIIQEMAINAALGMAAIIITNKFMLPVILTWVQLRDVDKFRRRQRQRKELGDRLWKILASTTEKGPATAIVLLCTVILGASIWKYQDLQIGDLQTGVPELRPDSRYNQDSGVITQNFTIGVDLMKIMAETDAEACIRHDVMSELDRFTWHLQNTPGVQMVVSLPTLARRVRTGWNEGNLAWQDLPRNQFSIVQSIKP
ncbi:MAG: MMPL family transporter, partial [Salinisphaeraceae bacterium]|nr:MMPL family transporter [Salinisphaeraceae bacterium]